MHNKKINTRYVTHFPSLGIRSAECSHPGIWSGDPTIIEVGVRGSFCVSESVLLSALWTLLEKKFWRLCDKGQDARCRIQDFWAECPSACIGEEKSTGTTQAAQRRRPAAKPSPSTAKHQTAKETSVKRSRSVTNWRKRCKEHKSFPPSPPTCVHAGTALHSEALCEWPALQRDPSHPWRKRESRWVPNVLFLVITFGWRGRYYFLSYWEKVVSSRICLELVDCTTTSMKSSPTHRDGRDRTVVSQRVALIHSGPYESDILLKSSFFIAS